MENDIDTEIPTREGPAKQESYIFGFIISLILTLISYFLVAENLISGFPLVATVGTLAFVQVVIQLIFFLHLGEEPSPPWNLFIFFYMVLMVLIIVIGSIWIMNHLDYQMMNHSDQELIHLHLHKD